ncbi:hypothetical protein AMELA_G00174110 [Ameiurus melas]|uniref:SAND domain-containing protein n=1 Tax=Ameiurus melas TaxID=219545 RepID=A0A7J6AFS0_AMEME|nr:hypothetical protein AMELA_G00174110 [Ameiurus melas]
MSSKKKQDVKPTLCHVKIPKMHPNAETPSSNMKVERKEKKQKQKKGATKRKKSGKETHEKRGFSSVFNQKIPAMKPPLCCVQIAINLPNAETPSSNTEVERKEKKQEQKKGATKRKKNGKETHEEERDLSSVFNQKKPAIKPPLSQLLEKRELPVTCGDKEGILYPDQLARGEKCILSEGILFTPCGFEKFSGRGNSKNWKLTIRCQNITLHKLIQEGKLQCRDKKVGRE